MKTFAFCALLGGLSFFAMSWQMGLFDDAPVTPAGEPSVVETKPEAPRAPFPDALLPAVGGKPVDQAAAFRPDAEEHRIAILYPNGALSRWQEELHEDWRAENVEHTEIVLVLTPQRKTFLSRQTYANGAPPVDRFQYELDVSAVAAKTGKLLAQRTFRNVPRPVDKLEPWELTSIGAPVSLRTVFRWLASASRAGFSSPSAPAAIVNVVD